MREGTVDQSHLVPPHLVDAQEELLGSAGVEVGLTDVCEGVDQIFLRGARSTRERVD